jgi:hypothetical protein
MPTLRLTADAHIQISNLEDAELLVYLIDEELDI